MEVKINPDPSTQQQLMKYVKELNAPYAVLATVDKEYWFEGNAFLPIDEPEFNKHSKFLSKRRRYYGGHLGSKLLIKGII